MTQRQNVANSEKLFVYISYTYIFVYIHTDIHIEKYTKKNNII